VKAIKYKVERRYTFGWGDADWRINGRPMRFNSIAEAEAEIKEHVRDCREAVRLGYMESAEKRSELRVVAVTPRKRRAKR
jgi:hypothetical protein